MNGLIKNAIADARADAHFVGRLAAYKYYNMDQIVAQALTEYGKIAGMKRKEATVFSAAKSKAAMPISAIPPKTNGNGKAAANF